MGSSVRLQHAPIAIDGWTGVVLSGNCVSDVTGRALAAPSIEQWSNWLTGLVNDWRKLPHTTILKTSESVQVIQSTLPADTTDRPLAVVAKQVRSDSVWDILRSSSATRNFDRAIRLRDAGIATALPLACLERKSPRASWLITEFLDNLVDLDTFVLTVLARNDGSCSRQQRSGLTRAIAQVFSGMERANLHHRDMKASNILVNSGGEGDSPMACIVDLDGLSAARFWRSRWKPITRLAASLIQYPAVTTSDYARFLKDYLTARDEDPAAWPRPFPSLRRKAARYAQAARKRKTHKLDGY